MMVTMCGEAQDDGSIAHQDREFLDRSWAPARREQKIVQSKIFVGRRGNRGNMGSRLLFLEIKISLTSSAIYHISFY